MLVEVGGVRVRECIDVPADERRRLRPNDVIGREWPFGRERADVGTRDETTHHVIGMTAQDERPTCCARDIQAKVGELSERNVGKLRGLGRGRRGMLV